MNIDFEPLKASIEAKTCPEHNQHPQVTISMEKVELNTCCEPFHAELMPLINAGIEGAITQSLDDIFQAMGTDSPFPAK